MDVNFSKKDNEKLEEMFNGIGFNMSSCGNYITSIPEKQIDLSSVNVVLNELMIMFFKNISLEKDDTIEDFSREILSADLNLKDITSLSDVLMMGETIYYLRRSPFAIGLYKINLLLDIIVSYDKKGSEGFDINNTENNTLRDEILQQVSNVDYERLGAMMNDARLTSSLFFSRVVFCFCAGLVLTIYPHKEILIDISVLLPFISQYKVTVEKNK